MKTASTLIVFCVCALMVLGLVMLTSATMEASTPILVFRQLLWCGLGVLACLALATFDYKIVSRAAWVIVPLALLLLVLVLVPGFAREINGAKRWLSVGKLTIQPSELAKFAVIIGLAVYCESRQRFMKEFRKGFIVPGMAVGAFLLLIIAGKDYGTTALVATVGGMLLTVAGTRLRYLAPTLLLGLAGFVGMILTNPVRRSRIDSWLNPTDHLEGGAYQADQAMIALGHGGITGIGLGDSRQKMGFIPESHTDFIFAVLGEELGLIGTLAVVLLFIVLVASILYVAVHAREPLGFYLSTGIAFLIGMQAFINIGVVTSTLPNKGIALPFVSYGGSSLVTMLAAMGLVLSVARRGEVATGSKKSRSNPFSTGRSAAQTG